MYPLPNGNNLHNYSKIPIPGNQHWYSPQILSLRLLRYHQFYKHSFACACVCVVLCNITTCLDLCKHYDGLPWWLRGNPTAVWETWVPSLGWKDPLEEYMATHSSILAWRIPMDCGAWQATVSHVQRAGHDWATKHIVQARWQQDIKLFHHQKACSCGHL